MLLINNSVFLSLSLQFTPLCVSFSICDILSSRVDADQITGASFCFKCMALSLVLSHQLTHTDHAAVKMRTLKSSGWYWEWVKIARHSLISCLQWRSSSWPMEWAQMGGIRAWCTPGILSVVRMWKTICLELCAKFAPVLQCKETKE